MIILVENLGLVYQLAIVTNFIEVALSKCGFIIAIFRGQSITYFRMKIVGFL